MSGAATAQRVSEQLMDVKWGSSEPTDVRLRDHLAEASRFAGNQAAKGRELLGELRPGLGSPLQDRWHRTMGSLVNAVHYLTETNPDLMKRFADPENQSYFKGANRTLEGTKHLIDTIQVPTLERADALLAELSPALAP